MAKTEKEDVHQKNFFLQKTNQGFLAPLLVSKFFKQFNQVNKQKKKIIINYLENILLNQMLILTQSVDQED